MKALIFILTSIVSFQVSAGNDGGGMNPQQLAILFLQNEALKARPVEVAPDAAWFEYQQGSVNVIPVTKFKFVGSTDYSKLFNVNGNNDTYEILDSSIEGSPNIYKFVSEAMLNSEWISIPAR